MPGKGKTIWKDPEMVSESKIREMQQRLKKELPIADDVPRHADTDADDEKKYASHVHVIKGVKRC